MKVVIVPRQIHVGGIVLQKAVADQSAKDHLVKTLTDKHHYPLPLEYQQYNQRRDPALKGVERAVDDFFAAFSGGTDG